MKPPLPSPFLTAGEEIARLKSDLSVARSRLDAAQRRVRDLEAAIRQHHDSVRRSGMEPSDADHLLWSSTAWAPTKF